MKNIRLLYRVALLVLLVAGSITLFVAYKTMEKQNHLIPILEYHNLTAEPGTINLWTVNANDFDDQMSYLNRNCHVVPLKILLEQIQQGKPIPEHTVAVTFDDGYQSNYLLAYPILKKYQIPATMFVIGKYTENGSVVGYKTMTWTDLKTMALSGLVDIESHTYNLHCTLPDSNGIQAPAALAHIPNDVGTETEEEYDRRIESDLMQSRQDIESKLGTNADILSWPFGAYNNRTLALAQKAGFAYIVGPNGYCSPTTDIENVSRVQVLGGMGIQEFESLVCPGKVTYFQAVGLKIEQIKFQLSLFRRV